MTTPTRKSHLLAALVAGAVVLVAGVALARVWLPEWRPGLRERSAYVQRYREMARQAGVQVQPGTPRATLISGDQDEDEAVNRKKQLDRLGLDRAAALGEGLRVQVSHTVAVPREDRPRRLDVVLAFGGKPLSLSWTPVEGSLVSGGVSVRKGAAVRVTTRRKDEPPPPELVDALARLLVAPGEKLGRRITNEGDRYPLSGSDPVQHLEVTSRSSGSLSIHRELGGVEPRKEQRWQEVLPLVLGLGVPRVLGVIVMVWLFLRLLIRRRIDFANGWLLGTIAFAVSIAGLATRTQWKEALGLVVPSLFLALWVVAAWSTGESYLRSMRGGFTTSLDLLRARRLGPRGGSALLHGMGLGALLAGLRLAVQSAAAALPGTWPEDLSVRFPPLDVNNPVTDGILLAASVAVALALAYRYLPERWVSWMAALAGGLAFSVVVLDVRPIAAGVLLNAAQGLFLVWVLRRFGLTALVTTTVASYLLPTALFSAFRLAWIPVPFAVTAALSAALLALGWVGLGRPDQIERESRQLPAFVRRMEEERRLKYEMDLLSRMQLGLLPEKVPEIPGWEIAARSLLATEAGGDLYDFLQDEEGRLWIAAGDVAGHGYSCSIAQAMTAASLASLVHAGENPAGILQRVDRVLRRNRAHRNFTTLALVRLDTATGEGTLANAGHPYPLLAVDGEAAEIPLAGLPLGQGPPRSYAEAAVRIPPGGVLLFCSDGLFEAVDWQANAYGYDRPRELLRTLSGRPALEILEALLADWRAYRSSEDPPSDDTTVVVVRRLPA